MIVVTFRKIIFVSLAGLMAMTTGGCNGPDALEYCDRVHTGFTMGSRSARAGCWRAHGIVDSYDKAGKRRNRNYLRLAKRECGKHYLTEDKKNMATALKNGVLRNSHAGRCICSSWDFLYAANEHDADISYNAVPRAEWQRIYASTCAKQSGQFESVVYYPQAGTIQLTDEEKRSREAYLLFERALDSCTAHCEKEVVRFWDNWES